MCRSLQPEISQVRVEINCLKDFCSGYLVRFGPIHRRLLVLNEADFSNAARIQRKTHMHHEPYLSL